MERKSKLGRLAPEQRHYRRFRTRLPVRFFIRQYQNMNLAPLQAKAGEGVLTNLSLSGCEFTSALVLPTGMEINLVFNLPDQALCTVAGTIVRVASGRQKHAYGVAFTDPAVSAAEIGTYVENRIGLEQKIGSYLQNAPKFPFLRR